MPPAVHLRPYRRIDVDAALDVWDRASGVAHPFLGAEFLADERRRLADNWLPDGDTTVAELDGRVVGWISLDGAEVGGLFVAPEHQGRGVGRALMEHAVALHPILELGVFEDNPVGRRFHDRFGFELVGRHRNDEIGRIELRLRYLRP